MGTIEDGMCRTGMGGPTPTNNGICRTDLHVDFLRVQTKAKDEIDHRNEN